MTEQTIKETEHYLELFEDAISKHKEIVGEKIALDQARQAGLGVSPDGHIVSCVGHPVLVLLRLIKVFAENSEMITLSQCIPLINEMERITALVESPGEASNPN